MDMSDGQLSVNISRLMFQSTILKYMYQFGSTVSCLWYTRQIILIHKQRIIVHIQASQSDKRTSETGFVA